MSQVEYDPRFVSRWADRYLDIYRGKGEVNARAWARQFLNPRQFELVVLELERRAREV